MANELATQNTFKTALVKAQEIYTPMIINSMKSFDLELDNYAKLCLVNSLSKINELISNKQLAFKDVDQSNLSQILLYVSSLKLNASATPRECYFTLRQTKQADGSYKNTIELGIEGNGNDALLRKYGVDVDKVLPPFIVHEGDEFTYPYFDGEKMCPVTWKPKSYSGKVTHVCYIVIKKDGSREYLIAERESVAQNLRSHIANNLMWAKGEQKEQILKRIENMTLDKMLEDYTLRGQCDGKTIMSVAWYGAAREQMIERKMRNNAIKKYPKDFKNTLLSDAYESSYEDYDQYRENSDKATFTKPQVIDAIPSSVEDVYEEIDKNSGEVKVVSEVIPTKESKPIATNNVNAAIPQKQSSVQQEVDEDDIPF